MIKTLITGISLEKDCDSNPCMAGVLGLAYIPVPLLLKGVKAAKNIPELESIGFHHLRHTFASQRVGIIGVEELRALMGHEKIQTTLRYSKVTSQRAEEVAQKAFKKIPPFGQ